MEASRVQRIARVLNVLVLIALICNIIVLYLVPAAVLSGGEPAGGVKLCHAGKGRVPRLVATRRKARPPAAFPALRRPRAR